MNFFIYALLAIIILALLVKLIRNRNRSRNENIKTLTALIVVLVILGILIFTPIGGLLGLLSTVGPYVLGPAALIALPVFIILVLIMLFRERDRSWAQNKVFYISLIIALALLIADAFYVISAPANPLGLSGQTTPTVSEQTVE